MIYLYDKAICDDLVQSFNPNNVPNPVVKVIAPESLTDLAAQIQEDKIKFPIVAVDRLPESIDSDRTNFNRLHTGLATVIDDNNNIWYEKVVPIKLNYDLTVIATNKADMDELVRELIFKYISQYFLKIKLPYESNRTLRFGVALDRNANIDRNSGSAEYLQTGKLYQSILHLNCEGCVLVNYTPAHLVRTSCDNEVLIDPNL